MGEDWMESTEQTISSSRDENTQRYARFEKSQSSHSQKLNENVAPVGEGRRTSPTIPAQPMQHSQELSALEQFKDDWRLHPIASTVNHNQIHKHLNRGVAKFKVQQLGWEEEKTSYLEFDEDKLQILELEGFWSKTPIVKYVIQYNEHLQMTESPNLTDPFIFKVSADPLRQPLFFTSKQRNEIIIVCCALSNEAAKRHHAEELRRQRQAREHAGEQDVDQSIEEIHPSEESTIKGLYEVLFDYLPEDPRLLKVEAAQRITVVGKRDDWLLAIDSRGHMGFVPPTYC